MSIVIEIKKTNVINDVHYYSVKSDHKGRSLFYIGIDSKKNQIMFFDDDTFSNSIAIIDQTQGVIKGDVCLYPAVSGRVLVKAYQALKENSFPDDISWIS